MANPKTGSGKRKTVFEVYQKKREHAEERNKTRVFLGDSFKRWRALKAQRGLQTDALVAKFLLDSVETPTEAASAEKSEPATSSPLSTPQQDHFKKLTEVSSAEEPEPATPSPPPAPQQDQIDDEQPELTSQSPPSAPLPLHKERGIRVGRGEGKRKGLSRDGCC